MQIYNFEQGSPEWHEIRQLKMTASHAQAIANAGKGLDTYIFDIIKNYVKFKRNIESENYTNKDIERGNLYEPLARASYEMETGLIVKEVGFIEQSKYIGCSPDGLIYENNKLVGGVEFKALNNDKHFSNIINYKPESSHIWQILMSMYITGAEWWVYGLFNPKFNKSLIRNRIYPDIEKYKKIEIGLKKGELMIEKYLDNEMIKNEINGL